MVRQMFDTLWIGFAIIAGFCALLVIVFVFSFYAPFAFLAAGLIAAFLVAWTIAKDRASGRR